MILALSGAPLVIVSIIAFILIIGVIISLHELGHLIVAKKSGILCTEYSIGMGPVIYEHRFGETMFRLRAIPIGGFVQMAGLDLIDADDIRKEETVGLNLDEDSRVIEVVLDPNKETHVRGKAHDMDLKGDKVEEGEDPNLFIEIEVDGEIKRYNVNPHATYIFEKNQRLEFTPYHRTFDSKKKLPRFLTLLAGSFMNFVLALVVYIFIAFCSGVPNHESNVIGEVSEYYPAYNLLEAGDKITNVNGISVSSWDDLDKALDSIYSKYQTELNITIERNGEVKVLEPIEVWSGSNALGFSNLQAKNSKLSIVPGTDQLGLQIGSFGLMYRNSDDKDDLMNISNGKLNEETKLYEDGDYLVGIKFNDTEYDFTKTYTDLVEGYEVTGWGYYMYVMENYIGVGAPDITLKYYHKTDLGYKLIDYSDSKVVYAYTNEVLESQKITKDFRLIGIAAENHFDFFGCLGAAFSEFGNAVMIPVNTLKILFFPSDVRQIGVSNLSGFVGIFGMVESYINSGILALLGFLAMLSVNIGIVNLLPIPALDGGRILFVIIEAITGKKVPKKVEVYINFVFVILLLALMIFVTFNDISRLFG